MPALVVRAGGVLFAGLAMLVPAGSRAAEYVAPPVMPIPGAWQGKAQAVVRVLDKLDTHVELLTLAVNQTGSVGSLQVTPRSCLVRPDGLPADSAAVLAVRDAKGTTQDFSGWMFAAEPSLGVFESPVYGVQLVGCAGADVAPMAPPLPPPTPPPPSMQPGVPGDSGGDAGEDGSPPEASSPGVAPPDTNDAPPTPEQLNRSRPDPNRQVQPPQPEQPVPDQPPPDQPDPNQTPPQLF